MEDVVAGELVQYHGSYHEFHGYMIVMSQHMDMANAKEIRYSLRYGRGRNDYLMNVRRESFTIVKEVDA